MFFVSLGHFDNFINVVLLAEHVLEHLIFLSDKLFRHVFDVLELAGFLECFAHIVDTS